MCSIGKSPKDSSAYTLAEASAGAKHEFAGGYATLSSAAHSMADVKSLGGLGCSTARANSVTMVASDVKAVMSSGGGGVGGQRGGGYGAKMDVDAAVSPKYRAYRAEYEEKASLRGDRK